ncbi:MAG: 1,6-anhydro-N-acetylmuramyl-L-alanine amidase AmpD [Gammaproteobacteria bacterium]
MHIIQHRLQQARQVPSPNYNERPAGVAIDLLVIHSISLPPGEFGGPYIEQLFENRLNPAEHPYFAQIHQLQVSAHLLIRRDGELVQFVPFDQRAWHAGKSNFQGRENCNDFSIGIELEGTDTGPFEPVQYDVLAQVIRTLLQAYPQLSLPHIVGHSDIAPGRKTDPGSGFDWSTLHQLLRAAAG